MLIRKIKSPNFGRDIRYIIIHGTGMKSADMALSWLCNPESKVSCHYFIDDKGNVTQLVEDSDVAWHAGVSQWKDDRSLNYTSIGIELFNPSAGNRYPYSEAQYKSLLYLLKLLMEKYSIPKRNILGHSDIAPMRKNDPGVYFNWDLINKKLCSEEYFVEKKIWP